jgi:hypothetical protein
MKIPSFMEKWSWGYALGFGLLAFFFSQPHAGFMMALIAPLPLIYQLYKLAVHWKTPEQRRKHLSAVIIIVLACSVVATAHVHHHNTARSIANKVAQDVMQFKASYGRFPMNMAEIGMPEFPKKLLYRPKYSIHDGKPMLFYAATFVVFETWIFDFPSQAWVYRPD